MLKQFKSTSLADQVFDRLENDIIQGVYQKGEILTELKLVEQLGVSRTPIREALRRLEQERLIEDAGKGSRVLGITESDLFDIMTIRERVEGVAAYYATKNMTPEGKKELTHLVDLQEFYFEKRDAERLRQVDDQFHDLICVLSKRTVITDTLIPLHHKTLPEHRRKGAASMIVKALEDDLSKTGRKHIILETARTTPDSAALYSSLGYQVVDYYGSPAGADNCLCFKKNL